MTHVRFSCRAHSSGFRPWLPQVAVRSILWRSGAVSLETMSSQPGFQIFFCDTVARNELTDIWSALVSYTQESSVSLRPYAASTSKELSLSIILLPLTEGIVRSFDVWKMREFPADLDKLAELQVVVLLRALVKHLHQDLFALNWERQEKLEWKLHRAGTKLLKLPRRTGAALARFPDKSAQGEVPEVLWIPGRLMELAFGE